MKWFNLGSGKEDNEDPNIRGTRVGKTSISMLDAIENHYVASEYNFDHLQGDQRTRLENIKTNWSEKVARILYWGNEVEQMLEIEKLIINSGGYRAVKPAYKATEAQDRLNGIRDGNGLLSRFYQFEGKVGDYYSGEKFGKLMEGLHDDLKVGTILTIGDKGNATTGEWLYEQLDIHA